MMLGGGGGVKNMLYVGGGGSKWAYLPSLPYSKKKEQP